MRKPRGYWTKEKCAEEALKYETRGDFQKYSGTPYVIARRNGWLNDICSHMLCIRNYNWSKEKCAEEALKYDTRNEFNLKNKSAYLYAHKNGWLNDICKHMKVIRKSKNYWTKERCSEECKKYKTKKELIEKNSPLYTKIHRMGWIDDMCQHMEIIGNLFNRCVYAYEFGDNSVYVGLTYNLNKRNTNHLNYYNSKVYQYIQKTDLTPSLLKLTNYVDVNEAKTKEKEYVELYRNDGWVILNKAKTGGIGGNILKWTKEKCVEEAIKYNTIKDFCKNSNVAYISSLKNKWLDEICDHMIRNIKPRGYWTKEKCTEEALKYDQISQFKKSGAYQIIIKKGWLEELCGHMTRKPRPKDYWTKEICSNIALEFNSKKEFRNKNNHVYRISKTNGWLDEICSNYNKK